MLLARLPHLALLLVLASTFPACAGKAPGDTGTGTTGGGHGGAASASSSSASTGGTGGAGGAAMDAGTDAAPVDKSGSCTGTFGQALTNAFGRLDGTVLAVVKPVDTQCPMPNSTHVILEVTMNAAVYRMVVNVESTFGDPKAQYLALDHALPAPAWSEGWHPGLSLDYVADFGVHAPAFVPYPIAALSDIVTEAIPLGEKISVYATSSGGSSAHLIHRNPTNTDGAIVIHPDTAQPRALLFHFADQSF